MTAISRKWRILSIFITAVVIVVAVITIGVVVSRQSLHGNGCVIPNQPTTGVSAVVFLRPANTTTAQPCSTSFPSDLGCNVWWNRDDEWSRYSPSWWHSALLADYNTIIIYFPIFLADPVYGITPLHRLQQVVYDIQAAGKVPTLLLGRPEYQAAANISDPMHSNPSFDVVHNASATDKLHDYVHTVVGLGLPFGWVSLYWLAAASFCENSQCSQSEIRNFTSDIRKIANTAGVPYYQHLDATYWEGYNASQYNDNEYTHNEYDVNGYSYTSLSGVADGILAESWVQGVLKAAVQSFFAHTAQYYSPNNFILLCDIPNCNVYNASYPCATGSVQSDVATWMQWRNESGLLDSWGVWSMLDGGVALHTQIARYDNTVDGDSNVYGIITNDGSEYTEKGRLLAQYSAAASLQRTGLTC